MTDENNNGSPLSPAVQEIVHQVDPLTKGLSEEKRAQVRRLVARVTQDHSGLLPDPQTLAAYDEIIESGAERIMALVEKRSAHAMKQEDRVIAAQTTLALRGQWIGAGLAAAALGLAAYVTVLGHPTLAGVICTTTILGIITVFALRRMPQEWRKPGESATEEQDAEEMEEEEEEADRALRRKRRRGR